MEIILAIVVAAAVIFFGALISMGNERQRKAIDSLREQLILWAVQDLKIKHEHLARTVQIHDPLDWLNRTASKVCGYDLKLQAVETFEEPQSLSCISADNQCKVIFTPLSPSDIQNIQKSKQNRLGRFGRNNPLLSLPKNAISHELNSLTCGILLELELGLVWKEVTGQKLETINRFWMFETYN